MFRNIIDFLRKIFYHHRIDSTVFVIKERLYAYRR
nr:MAG TPA: hypothetical protein [Caudoviricetes sp.]